MTSNVHRSGACMRLPSTKKSFWRVFLVLGICSILLFYSIQVQHAHPIFKLSPGKLSNEFSVRSAPEVLPFALISQGSQRKLTSIHNVLHSCVTNSTFRLWIPRTGVNTIAHTFSLGNNSDQWQSLNNTVSHYKRAARGVCADYHNATLIPRLVLPHVCTECRDDIEKAVTLTMPLTDSIPMWQKVNSHAHRWGGPISVGLLLNSTLFGGKPTPTVEEVIELISTRVQTYIINSTSQLCFHAVYQQLPDPGGYFSINTLRNVAVHYSSSKFVMSIEADLVTATNMSHAITTHPRIIGSHGKNHRVAHVLHLFHLYNLRKKVSRIPDTKQDVLDMWKKKQALPMGKARGGGHKKSNDTAFRASDNHYKIDYIFGYEPYYVVERSLNPYYPEELLFGSQDKGSHAGLLNEIGFKFESLNPLFLLHPDHTHKTPVRPKHVYSCGARFRPILKREIQKVVRMNQQK